MSDEIHSISPCDPDGHQHQGQGKPPDREAKKRADKQQFMRFRTRDVFISEDSKQMKADTYHDNPLLRQKLLSQRQKIRGSLRQHNEVQ